MSGRDDLVELGAGSLELLRRRGLTVPGYDRGALVPRIVHIGVGGFHRAHLAEYCHRLAMQGSDWGICGLGLLDADRAMAGALRPQDHLYTLTTRRHDTTRSEVIGSIIDYVFAADDPAAAVERISRPMTAIVSLTVTEAGYDDNARNRRTFDVIVEGLARRRAAGHAGVTVLSCDNLAGNGDAARRCVLHAAHRRDQALADWVAGTCSFPNSMVDRITPTTFDGDRAYLVREYGLVDRWPVVAEPFQQWIVEDDFVAGRPDIAAVGAVLTDDVHPWELYKLRLLNAGHSVLGHLATLAHVTYVDEALAMPELRDFLHGFLLEEALPTVTPIAGHSPHGYVADVLDRFANPAIRDRVDRLCGDGTAKVATFLVPVLCDLLDGDLPIRHISHALAGWAHYLAEVPPAQQASDPAADRVRPLARAALGDPAAFLEGEVGFPDRLLSDRRFTTAFTEAHRSISRHGAIGSLRRLS